MNSLESFGNIILFFKRAGIDKSIWNDEHHRPSSCLISSIFPPFFHLYLFLQNPDYFAKINALSSCFKTDALFYVEKRAKTCIHVNCLYVSTVSSYGLFR